VPSIRRVPIVRRRAARSLRHVRRRAPPGSDHQRFGRTTRPTHEVGMLGRPRQHRSAGLSKGLPTRHPGVVAGRDLVDGVRGGMSSVWRRPWHPRSVFHPRGGGAADRRACGGPRSTHALEERTPGDLVRARQAHRARRGVERASLRLARRRAAGVVFVPRLLNEGGGKLSSKVGLNG
jgi:hypothetical protein